MIIATHRFGRPTHTLRRVLACVALAFAALVAPATASAAADRDPAIPMVESDSSVPTPRVLDEGDVDVEPCPPQDLSQSFLPWGDDDWYFHVPMTGEDWTASGGAVPTEVGWELPAGARTTSPAQCIELRSPTMRLMASSPDGAVMRVDVRGPNGFTLTVGFVWLEAQAAPTPILPVVLNLLAPLMGGSIDVRVRLVAVGGTVVAHDLAIDPWKRG